MTGLDLTIVVPNTPKAKARGCTCPDPEDQNTWRGAMLSCGGHLFAADCPVHRNAVKVEVQRIMGRAN